MIFQELFPEIFAYHEIKVLSWSIVIIFAFISGIILLFRARAKKKEFTMRKQFFTSGAFLLFGFALIRLMFLLSDLEKWTNGDGSLLHFQFVYAGYNLLYFSFCFMVKFFDIYIINSKKHIVTISFILITSLCISLFFLLPILLPFEEITRYILYSGLYYAAFIMFVIFITILYRIRLKGFLRFFWAFLGFLLILLSTTLENYIPLPIIPIAILIGYMILLINVELTIKLLSEYFAAKKLCLIHRGEIKGKIVFCPQCYVKYCQKCFDSVITVEGNCWACEFDFTKQADQNRFQGKTREEYTPIEKSAHKKHKRADL